MGSAGSPEPADRGRLRPPRRGLLVLLAGTPYAVTFVYTRCPDVCILIGQQVRRALELLGPKAREVPVLMVSVDPRGDNAEAARSWMRRQNLPANVRYLIGSEDQLRPVWDGYYAAPQVPGRPETSSHTASVWLVDSRGRRRTKYSAGIPVPPRDLAHDLRVLVDEAPSPHAG